MTRFGASSERLFHVCAVGLSSYLLETLRGCRMLRATPFVFERERFPVLWCVLIRALWLCEYVYKMLTTVSLSVTSDPVTSQSSRDSVPVSSFRLYVESGPDPVNWSTAQPQSFFLATQMGAFCLVMGVSFFIEKVVLYRIYIWIYFLNTPEE